MDRFIDIIFLLYFLSHIPIALFFDSQSVLPTWIYPKQLADIMDWYTTSYKDTMMKEKPAWFRSFCVCELTVQFPFFFVASYAYWKGVRKCQWIRIPVIVYSSHVATSLVCIFFHIFLHDFSEDKYPGPRDVTERLTLSMFYMPYFVVPVMLLLDAIFNPIYTQSVASRSNKRGMKQH